MTDQNPFRLSTVELRAAVEINGRKVQAIAHADPRYWKADPGYQEHMKAELLRALGEAVVKELAPEVTVTMPEPTLHEALTETLRPFDYPYGELGL